MSKLNQSCPNCGGKNNCHSNSSCWCHSFPLLEVVERAKSCLCEVCLERLMAEKFNQKEIELSAEDRLKVMAMGEPSYLRKNLDYQVNFLDGRELYEFTSWYLLRRGSCCYNDCKNCPYPKPE